MQQVMAELVGEPLRYAVDGVSDDLLTAGLGRAGLRAAPPGYLDPLAPTSPELRRRAIYLAYRGLVDVTDAGGFGRFFGPLADEGVAGVEYLAAVRTPDGGGTTTVLLQIPASFDPDNPCLLAVASSGSRGVYGGLPTAAEWGLRRGHAVVHTDKGTGVGVWDLSRRRGYRIDGQLTSDTGDPLLSFAPAASAELDAFAAAAPDALLCKHAQSGLNPEADWGTYLLQAIKVGFELLNRELGPASPRRFNPDNTLVMAAGISNGGATVLRALERDRAGWISGAVASEPSVVVTGRTAGLSIVYGGRRLRDSEIGIPDYTSLHYLYQPAAVLAETDPTAPFYAASLGSRAQLEQWCRDLQSRGLAPAGDIAAAAAFARTQLLAAGIVPDALALGHFNVVANLWSAITTSYAWAYARRPPWQPYAGVSFAATGADGLPRALTDAEAAGLWAEGTGIAPTAGISIVATDPSGQRRAANAGSVPLALAYASELRIAAAQPVPGDLPSDRAEMLAAVREGQARVVMTARVGNRPVIIVHGRADGLIPVNHTSRAYYLLNCRDRGDRDELRYYEVVHGQHFDGYLGLPGFAEAFVPLQAWLCRALDALCARLREGTALPPSQVIRSRPRGRESGQVPPLSAAHLGELRADPGADAIRYADGVLTIPD